MLIFAIFCIVLLSCDGYCPNECSGHGTCIDNDRCDCVRSRDGQVAWTGNDCSYRACPLGIAWVGEVVSANNLHPLVECSNAGDCDRTRGLCVCYLGFEGVACQRTECPNNCNGLGICYTQKQLAENAGAVYNSVWDASKQVGCVCDVGYRGPDCSLIECPSGKDINGGPGNSAGRDCSGRGTCDYSRGVCSCFLGFYGRSCQYQVFFDILKYWGKTL